MHTIRAQFDLKDLEKVVQQLKDSTPPGLNEDPRVWINISTDPSGTIFITPSEHVWFEDDGDIKEMDKVDGIMCYETKYDFVRTR